MTAMPKHPPSLKNRRKKNLPPQQLYETLCGIFPEKIAAEKFEHLMGYAPPQEWRKPETPLHIFPEEGNHGTTD